MLQKILHIVFLFILIVNISSPEYLYVQAEENDNKTVEEMFKDKTTVKDEEENIGEQEDEVEVPTFESQFSWFDFFKMFVALGTVIALIYLLLRFVNQRNRIFGQARMMQNLGGISLGNNRSIQVVKINDRIFIVGVGDSIQLLKEIDSEDEVKKILDEKDNEVIPQTSLLLTKLFSKSNRKVEQDSDDFKMMLKNQLDSEVKGRRNAYDKVTRREDKE